MTKPFLCLIAAAACCVSTAQGQLLFDFESGLQGWGTSGFGNGTEFVGLSATGATEGSAQALSFGHLNGGFSWDPSFVIGTEPADPVYQALSNAGANPAGKTIDFDITFIINDLQSYQNFANVTFSLQSDAGFKQVNNVAEIPGGASDTTISVSLPLDMATTGGDISGITPNSSFYRLTFALNTDSSSGLPDTAYVDNIRIVPEPASALLMSLAALTVAGRRRRQA